ncbi:MAG TPA: hypothetical protein VHO25_12730 [Polyangiaceae bacterium]|nr:hypothetical protein [Polyangiaceae bacterium]
MNRTAAALILGASAGCLVLACGEEGNDDPMPGGGTCTAVACLGRVLEVGLIDENGAAALARGEFRDLASNYPAQEFDCSVDPDDSFSDLDCFDGTIRLDPFFVTPEMELEVRFQLGNGDYSEWQSVPLQISDRVIEDFNGPGCDCTVYDAFGSVVEVPPAARLTPPNDGGLSDAGINQPDATLSDASDASITGDSAPLYIPDASIDAD